YCRPRHRPQCRQQPALGRFQLGRRRPPAIGPVPTVNSALRLIGRRAISSIPVLLIVVIGTFFLLELAPGDAVDAYLVSIGGGDAALTEQLRAKYGLDQSPLSRLWLYVTALLRFDLGWSVGFNRPIS